MKRMKVKKGIFIPWNPMKVNIERWLKKKELEFT
jgi:hypothetical protein